MAIKRVVWGNENPFSDPRLRNLKEHIHFIWTHKWSPPQGVAGGGVWRNEKGRLHLHGRDYYREYDLQPTIKGVNRGMLRLILGKGGDIYLTGDHYDDFLQIEEFPATGFSPPP